jgi:hypothetical protein
MKRMMSPLAAIVLSTLVGKVAHCAVISDFEPPMFTADTDIAGVDGWIAFDSAEGKVMPSASTGYIPPTYPILSGSQSFAHYREDFYGRAWGLAASEVTNRSTFSWLMRTEFNAASGYNAVYFSHNVGIGGGSTPGGVELNEATNTFHLFGDSGSTNTAVSYTPATTYLLEMELNFTSDQFETFVTDVTNNSARASLGIKAFVVPLDAATVASNGGIFFGRLGGTAAMYDDFSITAIPDPPVVPGDFDSDGDVDEADFVAWQNHFPTAIGATLVDGDADGDGDVDGADFVVWQTNFPFTPSSDTSPVPEPASIGLIVIGSLTCLLARYSRRGRLAKSIVSLKLC